MEGHELRGGAGVVEGPELGRGLRAGEAPRVEREGLSPVAAARGLGLVLPARGLRRRRRSSGAAFST